MSRTIAVFCSSSSRIAPHYFAAADDFGQRLADRGWTLVYGGSDVGLMGAVARAAKAGGGRVIGVIPEMLHARGIAYAEADELIVTPDLRQRKAQMAALADAFVALPGGVGTLEEILEVLALKDLSCHHKPVVFLNTAGFYDRLAALFEQLYHEGFSRPALRHLHTFVPDVPALMAYLEAYQPPDVPRKWGG